MHREHHQHYQEDRREWDRNQGNREAGMHLVEGRVVEGRVVEGMVVGREEFLVLLAVGSQEEGAWW